MNEEGERKVRKGRKERSKGRGHFSESQTINQRHLKRKELPDSALVQETGHLSMYACVYLFSSR